MISPNIRQSNEVDQQEVTELVVSIPDLQSRFQTNADNLRAINRAIEDTNDPDTIVELASIKIDILPRAIGSFILWAIEKETLKERQDFESEFGSL